MAAIRTSHGRPRTETSLGKIQTVTDGPAHPVRWNPAHIFLADASLQHQVFDETSDGIVRERGDDRSVHPKAAPETAGDVVFTSALPCAKMTRVSVEMR